MDSVPLYVRHMDGIITAWDEPLPLVAYAADGKLEVVETTVKKLDEVRIPVDVVSVVGPFRTGKSSLLNCIVSSFLDKNDVFRVGGTVQAETKGIFIWCAPHPTKAGHCLVLLDTEGLDDAVKGDGEGDMMIFVLAILLSSTLLYNSQGVIDFQALERLRCVSLLAEKLRVLPPSPDGATGGDDDEEIGFDLIFPEFVWVVRDFQLNLEHNGVQVTDDEYLDKSLSTTSPSLKRASVAQSSIKRCLKEYFPRRKCFLLPSLLTRACAPAEGKDATDDKMRLLVQHTLSCDGKIYEGNKVTGRVFGKLTESYVEEAQRFSSQEPINIQIIMNNIAEKENSKAVEKSLNVYRTAINDETREALHEVELHRAHLRCSEFATSAFMSSAIFPIDASFANLMDQIKEEFDGVCRGNETKMKEFCKRTFQALRREIVGENNCSYFVAGGYEKYRGDTTELRRRWEEIPVLQGTTGHVFLSTKLKELEEHEGTLILQADQQISALQREEEAKRQEAQCERNRKEAEDRERQNRERMERDAERFSDDRAQFKSAVDAAQQLELSKLRLRIDVLTRELQELRELQSSEDAQEEAENCEYHLKMYQRMLEEKQVLERTRWEKVALCIRTFTQAAIQSLASILIHR